MISCIILAAGASERFKSPKALAELGDSSVIERIQRTLLSTSIQEIIVVLGSNAEAIKPFLLNHKRIRFVYNKDHKIGQTTSFQTGIRELSYQTTGVFIWPVDCPLIQAQTIQILNDFFVKENPFALIPTYQGKRGHPPIFGKELCDEILSLDPSVGVNTLFQGHPQELKFLEVDDKGAVASFNTKEEFDGIKQNLA